MSLRGTVIVGALLMTPLATLAAQAAALSDLVLRPGDALRVTVWGHPEMSGDFRVAPDSTLVHPVYQSVKAAGEALIVVKERLRRVLAAYEEGVQFVIEPLLSVTVAGEVRQPNLYLLAEGTTFAQAIARAGGPTELGRLEKVRVIRRNSSLTINLGSGYSRYAALQVASGDQVLVTRRSNFSVLRDVVYPLTSLTAAVAAVLAYSRYGGNP